MRHGRDGADRLCGVELVSILGGRGAQVMFSLLEPAAVPGEHWSLPAHNCLSAARPQTRAYNPASANTTDAMGSHYYI